MRYLLPLLFLVGCAKGSALPGPLEATVDPTFTEAEQIEIKLALGDWQSTVEFDETAPPTHVTIVREVPHTYPRVGEYEQEGGLIRLMPNYRIDRLRRLATHEIGHALIGLQHEDPALGPTVMAADISKGADTITPRDVQDYYNQ